MTGIGFFFLVCSYKHTTWWSHLLSWKVATYVHTTPMFSSSFFLILLHFFFCYHQWSSSIILTKKIGRERLGSGGKGGGGPNMVGAPIDHGSQQGWSQGWLVGGCCPYYNLSYGAGFFVRDRISTIRIPGRVWSEQYLIKLNIYTFYWKRLGSSKFDPKQKISHRRK